jgi:hypothetical protein
MEPMGPTEIDDLVDEAARLIVELYVFPDVGIQIAAGLRERAAIGRYAEVADDKAFAALVTEDLQRVNGDLHLRLKHHDEELPDLPGTEMMTAMVTADAARTMNGVARVERLAGNAALLELAPILYPPSIAGAALGAAMNLVASASTLIIDLRNCIGGDPHTVAFLCSYLFDESVHLIDIYDRATDTTTQSWTLPFVPGDAFGGTKPLFVLIGGTTFSGGEEFAYDLQQHKRAILIGEPTGGGAHPRVGKRLSPHLELTVPTCRAIGPLSGTNWEGVGVLPDIPVPAADALTTALRKV